MINYDNYYRQQIKGHISSVKFYARHGRDSSVSNNLDLNEESIPIIIEILSNKLNAIKAQKLLNKGVNNNE